MRRSAGRSQQTGDAHSCRERVESRPAELVSIDVADPRFADPKYWMRDVDLEEKLEELHPGDPGQLSGVVLNLGDSGEYAFLSVNLGMHCLGWLSDWPLRGFLRRALTRVQSDDQDGMELTIKLGELYPQIVPWRPSGGVLRCSGVGRDTELGVYFGTHCFGIARGGVLREFLRRATIRAMAGITETEADNSPQLRDSDHKFLRAAGISAAGGGL